MNNFDDFEPLSNCCTALTDEDTLICGECGEHCELLGEEEQCDGTETSGYTELWQHEQGE